MKIAHARSSKLANDKQVDITDYMPMKWNYIIRPLDKIQSIIDTAKKCCNNNHILYSQCTNSADPKYRLGLCNKLKLLSPDEINYDVYCDCSSFVQAIIEYCGYNIGYLTTSTMRDCFQKHPRFIVKAFNYNEIKSGDILLMEGTHTAIVVEVDTECKVQDINSSIAKTVKAEPYLNMRSNPSMDGEIVCKIPNGSEVDIIRTQGSWSYVYFNSHKGWCSNYYLK